jgi:GH24 family phage-related lysozyme (muramidase)
MIMNISEYGKKLIKSFESCKLVAYKATPTEQYYTIGWGHYGSDVKKGQTITQSTADALFNEDIKKFEKLVQKYPNAYYNQNQYDALVCFCYNIGSINQLTANGTRTQAQISAKIPAYNKQNGKVLNGLVKRRAAEKALYDKAVSVVVATPTTTATATTAAPSKKDLIMLGQAHSYNVTGVKIACDGIVGNDTRRQKVRVLQAELNADYKCGLIVDGDYGGKTQRALGTHYVQLGEKQEMVRCLQVLLYMNGYDPKGTDASFGNNTLSAFQNWQDDNGVSKTTRCTAAMFVKLIK